MAGGAPPRAGVWGVRSPHRNPLDGPEPFVVELERFHGPLDLLLHLIRQQDIDIFDIPVARITDQFLTLIQGVEETDLDGAGEFLEMAATLVRLKAQMLLPRPMEDEDDDPRAELVRRLLEYEQIREIAERLARSEADRARRFPKGYVEALPAPDPGDAPLETTWADVFQAALGVRLPESDESAHRVTPRGVAMAEKVRLILDRLEAASRVQFRTLVEPWTGKMHGVMTLLAGLELAKRRAIHLRQTRPFAELWLYRGEPEELDSAPATGLEGVEAGDEGPPRRDQGPPEGHQRPPEGDEGPPEGDHGRPGQGADPLEARWT